MKPLARALPCLLGLMVLAHSASGRAEQAPVAAATGKASESFDDQARFLAGLPVAEGSPLATLQQGKDWQEHAKALDADWAKLEQKRLRAMAEWRDSELEPRFDLTRNLYYVFGGPDLISVAVLYPDAPVYVLCGLELIGQVPALSGLKRAALDRAMDNLRRSIASTVRASFFKTNDMAADLSRTELKGVLPLLYLFLARSNATLLDVKLIEIDRTGAYQELAAGAKPGAGVPGARLRFKRAGQEKEQEIFYLRQNVESTVLAKSPGFLAFLKRHGPANSFFKAASFILHNSKRFSRMREFVLENSLSILQDDSGVPFNALKDEWRYTLYGRYLRPLPPFQRHLQEELVKAFATGPVKPLPFVTGYRRPGDANLLLALPKATAQARPQETPAAEPEIPPGPDSESLPSKSLDKAQADPGLAQPQ
ncbi:MAG: hypothetical protein HY901_00795 [Deltaproteobacteria bacterium]|nr:hypothetical protein [Deltaproteobacteria bacterium]